MPCNGSFILAFVFALAACRVEPPTSENTFELRGKHTDLGCADCHDPGTALGPLPTDCASCHLQDAAPGHFQPPCEACHDEFGWDVDVEHLFFPLQNAHELPCDSCHSDGVFEGLEPSCVACHETDRPVEHFVGQDCGTCHTPTTWESGVDHSSFPLDGAHALDCATCHTAIPDFGGLSVACTACHAPDRPSPQHYLNFECSDCHERTTWPDLPEHGFFPLTGNHAQTCDSCHDAIPVFTGLNNTCQQCHEADRPNLQHFTGQDCAQCHTAATWDTGVDHSFFPLNSAHSIGCESCHLSIPDFTGLDQACATCHASDPPSADHFSGLDCGTCHQITTWASGTDHSFFPLTANHDRPCQSCHTAFPDFTGLQPTCTGCHEADRPSSDHFAGQNCAQCHTPVSWATGVDHSFFPLSDAHSVDCASCHLNIPDYTGLSQTCNACHAVDRPDPGHHPSFDCGACHTSTTWANGTDHSFFPLTSNHDQSCQSCHSAIPDFTGLQPQCAACHEVDRPDPQHFPGQDCAQCHSPTGWAGTDHSFFPLVDGHTIACSSCHTTIPDFAGLSQTCSSCHTPDRPPAHYTGFDCGTCHLITTWIDGTDHSQFPLLGRHAGACQSYHTAIPDFSGLQPACSTCHEADRLSPTHFAGRDCGECHDSFGWNVQVDHLFFPLANAHDRLCGSCHTQIPDYTGLQPTCTACHTADRPVPTHYQGLECDACHQTTVWADTPDHSFFVLDNSHAVGCDSCHLSIPSFVGLSPACASCHETDRPTPAHFAGQDCGSCHSNSAWTDAVDHSFFPLVDNHTLDCISCHVNAPIFTGLSQDCSSCHEVDRPSCHFVPQTCSDCHTLASTWANNASPINHLALFNFPVPHHQANTCAECHDTPNNNCEYNCLDCHSGAPNDHSEVNGFQFVSTACVDCHPAGQN